jgi:hypothetical protein
MRRRWLLLAALGSWWFILLTKLARDKPFWHDEVDTVLVARLPLGYVVRQRRRRRSLPATQHRPHSGRASGRRRRAAHHAAAADSHRGYLALARWTLVPVMPLAEFVQTHRRFWLYALGTEDKWIEPRLRSWSASFTPAGGDRSGRLFDVQLPERQ